MKCPHKTLFQHTVQWPEEGVRKLQLLLISVHMIFLPKWGWCSKSLECAYVIYEWSPRSSDWIHYCLDDKVHSYQRFSITRNLAVLSYELQQLFVGWNMRNVWHSFYPILWNISGTCVLTKGPYISKKYCHVKTSPKNERTNLFFYPEN